MIIFTLDKVFIVSKLAGKGKCTIIEHLANEYISQKIVNYMYKFSLANHEQSNRL